MKFNYLIFSLFFVSMQLAIAQNPWEIGVKTGAANYLGDIGGGISESKPWILDMKLQSTRYSGGFFLRKQASKEVSFEVAFNMARLTAADSLTLNPVRFSRNQSFRNDIYEANFKLIYSPIKISINQEKGSSIAVEGYFGAGIFYNNPKTLYEDTWYALQPLMTEGVTYSKWQPCFPIGTIVNYQLSAKHKIGLDIGWRFTLTDYIDDISGNEYLTSSQYASTAAGNVADRRAETIDNPRSVYYQQTPDDIIADKRARGGVGLDSYVLTSIRYSFILGK